MNHSAAGKVETLRWNAAQQQLELLDQRRLPQQLVYVACTDAASVAAAIRAMVVRGAPAIGVAAAWGIALEALKLCPLPTKEFAVGLNAGFRVLAASRPTAVNLFWALQRQRAVLDAQADAAAPQTAQRLLQEAQMIHAEDVRCNQTIGALGAALLPDSARVLTHCNAGALATAGYGTALGVIRAAVAAGKRIEVFADETRPFLQGARLTAWELVQEGIPVTIIADNMAGHLMSRAEIDAVIVGADRVAANGDVANKIGTYMVAVLAQRHGIPLYVACPCSTIDLSLAEGAVIPLEERPPEEVAGFGECRWAAPGARFRHPAFDVTPATLVSALITEQAVIHAPDTTKIKALCAARAKIGGENRCA